jgi:phytoene dehydrogenase-like protein
VADITSDVVVIGAGHNGLVCAFYLAKAGLKVTVVEARDVVGGAAVTEEFAPGFRNSTASYTVSLLQPKVIRDMALERHGLRVVLRKVDNFLPTEGSAYLLGGRGGLTKSEIARHSPADADRYDAYIAALDGVVAVLRQWLLRAPPNAGGGLSDLLALVQLGRGVGRLALEEQRQLLDFFTKSAAEILERYFSHNLVQALFGFDGVVGNFASPWTPGSAYVLLHHVFGEAAGVPGAWGHAIGGMGAITQAMASACRAQGVEIVTGAPVEEVIVERGRAAGVAAGGTAYRGKAVAAGVHPKLLFERLLPAGSVPEEARTRMSHWVSESATLRMNVALSELPRFTSLPEPGDHLTAGIIIAPSLRYMDIAYMDARRQGWSDAPVVEMLIPSTLDDSLAPAGAHVASLFCQHFRYELPGGWDANRDRIADAILAHVDRFAPGFAAAIVGRLALSPLDLERRFGLIGGDIFHGRMSLDQLFSARPMLGHADHRMPLADLYLCGSGAHPGGGVTGAPGHNAAAAILKDRRRLFRGRNGWNQQAVRTLSG